MRPLFLIFFSHSIRRPHIQILNKNTYTINKLLILWTILEYLPQIFHAFQLITFHPDNLFMHTTSLIQLKLFNLYRTEFEIDKYKELPKDNKLVQIHFIQM